MHDLTYKLCQLAKKLGDMGHGSWADVVQAAADEREEIKAKESDTEEIARDLERLQRAVKNAANEIEQATKGTSEMVTESAWRDTADALQRAIVEHDQLRADLTAARAEIERLRAICKEAYEHIHFEIEEDGPIKDRLISARQPGPGFPASETGHHTPFSGSVVVGDCKNRPDQ